MRQRGGEALGSKAQHAFRPTPSIGKQNTLVNNQPGKLTLPTVDTCRWRTPRADGLAHCGLLAELLGDDSARDKIVPHAACVACCQSFPPTRRNLNPVLASLLFDRTTRILSAGGTPGCSETQARQLLKQADNSLTLVHPERFRLTPARDSQQCSYLADPIPAGSVQEEPTRYRCQHPLHETTTSSECRQCSDWVQHKPVSRFLTLNELVPPPERRCGPAVKRWAVGVTTAPRRDPTLAPCLDSIIRAGWTAPRLFLDGSVNIPTRFKHLPVTWREDPVGAWPNWIFALTELLLQSPEADAYVLLQDDVILYDRESLRDYLEGALWPGDRPGLISLFYTGTGITPGWIAAKGAWHWGAQGFVLPPGIARALVCDPDISHTCLAAADQVHIPIPEVLADWTRDRRIDVWSTTPSLAQHIGNSSTIWMNAGIAAGRRAPWFSGSLESAVTLEEPLDEFPEIAFPCPDDSLEQYTAQLSRGLKRMQDSTVVVCGLCRDVRHFLPQTAARIERLGRMFRDYRVVLFENDSVDSTQEFLADWSTANPRVNILSQQLQTARYPQIRSLNRAAFLAHCRNQYRHHLLEHFADFDYVIAVDTDLPGGWSYDGIAHSYGMDDWDFVGSYGLTQQLGLTSDKFPYRHFDIWAFRPARGTAARKLVDHTKLELYRGDAAFPVDSCFGGLGIYRMECLQVCEYGGTDCEHVVLHQRMQQAGFDRLFLNPNQIVLYTPM